MLFIEDAVCFLPCSRATFYNHDLDKLDSLKDALQENKTNMKVSLRSKWFKSDNATLQLALMKLICSNEERQKLSMNYNSSSIDIVDQPLFPDIAPIHWVKNDVLNDSLGNR